MSDESVRADGESEPEEDVDACRYCRVLSPEDDLIAPCRCAGTQRFVHFSCLRRYIITRRALSGRDRKRCPTCRSEFEVDVRPPRRCEACLACMWSQEFCVDVLIRCVILASMLAGSYLSVHYAPAVSSKHYLWSMFVTSILITCTLLALAVHLLFIAEFLINLREGGRGPPPEEDITARREIYRDYILAVAAADAESAGYYYQSAEAG
jgi:hypothetical protein